MARSGWLLGRRGTFRVLVTKLLKCKFSKLYLISISEEFWFEDEGKVYSILLLGMAHTDTHSARVFISDNFVGWGQGTYLGKYVD